MKKIKAQIIIIAFILLILLTGCGQIHPANSIFPSDQSAPTSTDVKTTSTPEPSYIVVNERWRAFEDAEVFDLGDNTYYLDTQRILTNGNETGYMLYCRNNTTGIDIPLNILTYSIKAYGDHVYALIYNGEDLSFPHGINTLYRIENNGEIAPICSGDNYYDVDTALRKIDNKLYFTRYNENAIFKADLNCDDIERISIVLPEESDPIKYSRVTARGELYTKLDIATVEDGFIFFSYEIINESNEKHFNGYYKMSISDNHIDKEYSKYYDSSLIVGTWLYYVDLEHPTNCDEESLYELHRMKQDGSGDENLRVQCFRFDIAGQYLYADTGLVYGDFAHWNTYRYNIDGTGQKPLGYGNMVRYAEEDRLYFTLFDENVIHVADTACNELLKIKITVPDENTLRTNIGECYEFGFITVIDQKDEWISFEYCVTDTGPFTYYKGIYRVNLHNKKVEKVNDGEYFTPSWDS
jgi:hypothetical protein